MKRTPEQLREDALAIWTAGLEAVRSERLVRDAVQIEDNQLRIDEVAVDLDAIDRIAVVGAGKAGAGMAAALEEILGPELLKQKQVTGWINVPADCVRPLQAIHVHAGRPAGVNEPTVAGVEGTEEILRIVSELGPRDLCLCLIAGGGSALMPAPAAGISLEEKQHVTQFLSAAGANIEQLNTVRKQISRVKGGGLAHACRAGRLISLIISDVMGDQLSIIASGPTVVDPSTPQEALAALEQFDAEAGGVSAGVFDYLRNRTKDENAPPSCEVDNIIIGNNALAVDAAGIEAERRGYSHAMSSSITMEPTAEEVGHHHAEMALQMQQSGGPDCLITGGEPVVQLAPAAERGRGGRNQQLVLAAAQSLAACDAGGYVLLSGGTDGEDGPTDAAGAWCDRALLDEARRQGLSMEDHLRRNDAYPFFEAVGGLLLTGPTNTNVCDLRVVVVDRVEHV